MANTTDNTLSGDKAHSDSAAAETVDELAPTMTGRWLVTTQGSTHIWDLDEMTYTRIPGPHSPSGSFVHDRVVNLITDVQAWPRVGDVSIVWFADAWDPMLAEQWRQSSTIKTIQRLPDLTDTSAAASEASDDE